MVYFSAPIQAITTTSPYRARCRPAVASGCSAVTAAAAGGWVILSINSSFRACDMAWSRMRGGWPRYRPPPGLTPHRLFVAGQVPAWPARLNVCYRLDECSLKARHEPGGTAVSRWRGIGGSAARPWPDGDPAAQCLWLQHGYRPPAPAVKTGGRPARTR